MTAEAVLAIDQGTSGTKALVVDPEEGVIATAEVAVYPHYGTDGGVEVAPQALLDSVLTAGRLALQRAGRRVDTVSLANQGETVLAWEPSSGRALSPALVWQDRRASEVCDELRDHRDLLSARTGLVLDPYFSAPKMTWLRRHITRDGVLTTTDAWLAHQLAGVFVTDAATASRSLLMDIDKVDWDLELLELFGLGDEAMPTIVACDECVGTTKAFGSAMALAGLIVDQQAALFAQRCWYPGEAKCTVGTGGFLLANTGGHAVRSAAKLTSSVAWVTRGEPTYCVDGQVYTVASAVDWLVRVGLISQPGDLDGLSVADAGGVICVPAFAGLAAPWWSPEATATFTGITLATEAEHVVLAVLQGIAAQVAELADLVSREIGDEMQSLRLDGGLSQSQSFVQTIADVAQLPVSVYPTPDATALGVAGLGRMAQQPDLGADAAVLDWRPRTTCEPRWSRERALEFRARWRRAAAMTLAQTEQE